MPGMDGIEVLVKIQGINPDVPVIMISGHGNIETAVESLKKGAYDYISKPPDLNRLLVSIRNALDRKDLIKETRALKKKAGVKVESPIIGSSKPIEEVRHMIEKVAPHPLSIFLQVSLDGAHNRGGAGVDQLYQLAELVSDSKIHTLVGLMSVPPVGMDPDAAYSQLSVIRNEFLLRFPKADSLSAGMSGDYEVAISHGATHVRVGSSILGSRSPHQ